MNLATPYTVGVKKYQTGATDAHGNTVDTWAAPISVDVYSIAPSFSNEPYESGREAVITGLTVLAPKPSITITARDHIVVNGEEYKIEGDIGDWNMGPFEWTPGISISLKKVNG